MNNFDITLSAAHDALTNAAFFTGDYFEATSLLDQAQQRASAENDTRALGAVLDQQGFLPHWKNIDPDIAERDPDKELSLFEQALSLRQEAGDDMGAAESLFHIGLVHQIFKHDWETANTYYEHAKELAEQGEDDLLLSEIYRHIGGYFWMQNGNMLKALQYLRRSLNLREKSGSPSWIATGLLTLGQCELTTSEPSDALEHLREGLRIAEEAKMRPWWTASAKKAIEAATAADFRV